MHNIVMKFTLTLLLFTLSAISHAVVQDPDSCRETLYHGQGYTTAIYSVTENGDGSHTIVLLVEHNGCPGPECKAMHQYSVEADPGTYSDISVELLSGSFSYDSINYGPNLGGSQFLGFRISEINGMGNGNAASFLLTYTLTGGLQDQRTQVTADNNELLVQFVVADFESVMECQDSENIFPYYLPPEGGKIYNSLIGPELTSLYEIYSDSGYYNSDEIFQVVGNRVAIDIFAIPGQFEDLLVLLQAPAYGLILEIAQPGQQLISGQYPIENLLLLNELPSLINYAQPNYPAVTSAGIVTSQGDTSLRSYVARNAFNLDGDGVKIGVISDSYNTKPGDQAGDDVLRGDLPGSSNPLNANPVEVLREYPYGILSDEGRAMLHIIHDIAPKSTLAFRTGFLGAADFAQGIRDLKDAGCDVIVDDITYLSEPFLRDGIVAQAVEEVVSEGVAYFSSAGNFGGKSYQADFSGYPAPPGISGLAHDFSGSGDIFQGISLADGSYTIVLQWDDGTGYYNTSTDLDIYLARNNGSTLFGFNRVNTGGSAIEVLPFVVTGGGAESNLMIVKASGSGPVFLKYIIFRGNVTINEHFTGASTIVGQANAENAMAVGAVLYSNTPEFGVNPPTIASFSSIGGTPVNGVVRTKPDFTAPNGVNTNVDMGGVNIDGDAFPNFFGTSAAAPHAAAVAALVIEAKSRFYDAVLSPVELRGILQNSAIDMDVPGFDPRTGFGLIQADAALSTLANPAPLITGINYDTALVPGVEPIPVFVTGIYLTEGSVIYFNGEPLESGTVVVNDTLLSGIIPAFDNRYPPIQVYNPPLPQTNGTDGGLSEPLFFSSKKTVIIDIEDKSKKFGEVLPAFTAVYSVEGPEGATTLEGEGLTEEAVDRIVGIQLETVATDLSNAGLWEIRADLNDPLNPDGAATATDSLDLALLENYNFDILNGLLAIEKLDLLIKPRDTTIAYGETVTGLTFDYIYNNDTINPGNNVIIAPEINDSLQNTLRIAHTNALVTTVARVPATALVNEWGEPLLDSATLVNTGMIISEATALVNATALANGTLISPEALYNATALVNAVTRVNQTALVPATALVNGTALVNTFDGDGNLVGTNALFYATALVNGMATALVNTSTINANSNSDAIVILGDGDIQILSGDSTGNVVLRSISMVTGNAVGDHWIIPGAYISDNFNISYGLGKLTVEPATATVTADLKWIYAGDTLPDFTATFSGFVNGETDTVVTDLSFTLNPTYSGAAGTYQIIPAATADNYIFTPVNGSLIVNPYGAGTKNIKTYLDCVESVDPATNGGYAYLAYYGYDNNNATDVYIPIGPDNKFTGTGSYDGSQQPQLFVSGGGTFTVPFDGVRVKWTVRSFNGNGHKTASTSAATSKSSKCNKSVEAEDQQAINPSPDVVAYPNPVRDKLFINLEQIDGEVRSVEVFDLFGNKQHRTVVSGATESLEVDMNGLSAGVYIVRLNLGTYSETLRIIKL